MIIGTRYHRDVPPTSQVLLVLPSVGPILSSNSNVVWQWLVVSYPSEKRKIWKNIKMKLRMLYSYITAREISTLVKYRNLHGIFCRFPHKIPLRKVTGHLADLTELDSPFTKPSNVRLYGPIVPDNVLVRDLDPQLSNWLDAVPTILMSMGTLFMKCK